MLPELREVSPGVFEFSIARTPASRAQGVAFFVFVAFATIVCSPGIVLSFGHWYPFSLFAGFYVAVLFLLCLAFFRSTLYVVDVKAQTLARLRFLWSWRVHTSTWNLSSEDEIAIYWSSDEYGVDADHVVYVTSKGVDHSVCLFTLPVLGESPELLAWVDEIAQRLGIQNAGYRSKWRQFRRRLTRLKFRRKS